MLRKTMLLVPVFALALLAVSRVGGLAGKIGADGLAWAQDSSPASDDAQNDSGDVATAQVTPDKTKTTTIKFSGSGTFDATETSPCSHYECFSITGSVTKTSIPNLGTGDVGGDSWLDSCKINKAAKKKCCTFGSTQTYSFSDGDLDVTIGGTACGKTPTNVTVKSAKFEITGGTGLFAGASGSGKSNLTVNEDTGEGTFNFSGKLKE